MLAFYLQTKGVKCVCNNKDIIILLQFAGGQLIFREMLFQRLVSIRSNNKKIGLLPERRADVHVACVCDFPKRIQNRFHPFNVMTNWPIANIQHLNTLIWPRAR